jgi:ribose 5-phosphate isomerase A
MDYKMEAAKEALKLIRSGQYYRVRRGSTMANLIGLIKGDEGLAASLITLSSSFTTRRLLQKEGFAVREMGCTDRVDLYFDGCDQFDRRLSALKSGGGVHTSEKVLASMADEFIIVGMRPSGWSGWSLVSIGAGGDSRGAGLCVGPGEAVF